MYIWFGQRILKLFIGSVKLFNSSPKNCFPFLVYPLIIAEPKATRILGEPPLFGPVITSMQLIFAFGP